MRWVETINCRSGDPLPENLVKIFQLETKGWSATHTPQGDTYTYNYILHALMDDSLQSSKPKAKKDE